MKGILLAIGSSIISVCAFAAIQSVTKPITQPTPIASPAALPMVQAVSSPGAAEFVPANLGLPTDNQAELLAYQAPTSTGEVWNALNFYRTGIHTIVLVSPNFVSYYTMPQTSDGTKTTCIVRVFDRATRSQLVQNTDRACTVDHGTLWDSNGNQVSFEWASTEEEQNIAEYMIKSVGGTVDDAGTVGIY